MKKIEKEGNQYIVFENKDYLEKQEILKTLAKRDSTEKILEACFSACNKILAESKLEEAEMWKAIKDRFDIPEDQALGYDWINQRFFVINDPL
ncbi:MAG: hypothetical protein ACRC62_32755 [Microcoleus sp.]